MSSGLPQTVQPDRLAERGESLHGTMALKGMARLAGLLHDTDGEVDVVLDFGIDAQRVKFVHGHIRASLHLVCQRCLQLMTFPVDREVNLGLVHSEQNAEHLAEGYEPLVLEQPSISLKDMVEDELMLALPIVPKHAPEECGAERSHFVSKEDEERSDAQDEGRQHPFSGLDELIKKSDSSPG